MACSVKLWYSHKMYKIRLHGMEGFFFCLFFFKVNPVHTPEIISSMNVCVFILKTTVTKKM